MPGLQTIGAKPDHASSLPPARLFQAVPRRFGVEVSGSELPSPLE